MTKKVLTTEEVKKISEMNKLKGKDLFKTMANNYLETVKENKARLEKELPGLEIVYQTFKALSVTEELEPEVKEYINKELKDRLDILVASKNLISKYSDIINDLESEYNIVDWVMNNYEKLVELQYLLNIPIGLTDAYDIEHTRKQKFEKELTEEN